MKSLKIRIIAAIVLCTFLTSTIIGVYSIYSSTAVADSDADQIMQMNASAEAGELNAMIAGIEQSVDTLSSIVLDSMDFSQFKNNNEYVYAFTASLADTVVKFSENTQGAITSYIRYNPDFTEPTSGIFLTRNSTDAPFESVTPTDFSIYEKTDLAHVGWYYIPVENKAPIWMDPYLNENINVYMISYVVPLYVDGESVGIVGMDIDFSQITNQVNEINVFEDGYAFLVNADNQIMFHRNLDVGTAVAELEDGAMTVLADKLSDADNANTNMTYTYDGVEKSVVYSSLDNGMKLVLTVPVDSIHSVGAVLSGNIKLFSLFTLIIASVIGVLIGFNISNPIKKITGVLKQTAELDFRQSVTIDKLTKSKNEIGTMANAVVEMRKNLSEAVSTMTNVKEHLLGNVEKLDLVMNENNSIAEDTSATTEEIAAGMEETSASTAMITENVGTVRTHSKEISELTSEGKKNTNEIMQRAKQLGENTADSTEKTLKIFSEMQEKTKIAMEQSEAVWKINSLTENIREISSQTNLLALNANIEAARAGEAGRGFAVVATEIGSLANETFEAVDNINNIVAEVTGAVTNMSDCIAMLMDFIEKTVLLDYESFRESTEQYQTDVTAVMNIIGNIDIAVEDLDDKINLISESIESINTAVSETAVGINDIADKTASTVEKTTEGYEQLKESRENVNELAHVMERFMTE